MKTGHKPSSSSGDRVMQPGPSMISKNNISKKVFVFLKSFRILKTGKFQ